MGETLRDAYYFIENMLIQEEADLTVLLIMGAITPEYYDTEVKKVEESLRVYNDQTNS